MSFSCIGPARDGRPFFNVETCFRFNSDRFTGPSSVPGDFFDYAPGQRAAMLDELLAEWAELEGYNVAHCSWELLTELSPEQEEADAPFLHPGDNSLGQYGYRGRR